MSLSFLLILFALLWRSSSAFCYLSILILQIPPQWSLPPPPVTNMASSVVSRSVITILPAFITPTLSPLEGLAIHCTFSSFSPLSRDIHIVVSEKCLLILWGHSTSVMLQFLWSWKPSTLNWQTPSMSEQNVFCLYMFLLVMNSRQNWDLLWWANWLTIGKTT